MPKRLTTCLTALALSAGGAHADPVAAFGFSTASFATYDSQTAELGYDFTTGANPVLVTALGYVDDGFNGTHTIRVFAVATRAAVPGAVATVTTRGGGPGSTTFTYAPLAAPVRLAAHTQYQIVSQFFRNEHYFIRARKLVAADGLTIGNAVYDNYGNPPAVPTFARGVSAANNPGDFGPNMLVSAVP